MKLCATEDCLEQAVYNGIYCRECAKERKRHMTREWQKDRSKQYKSAHRKAPASDKRTCTYKYPDGHICGRKLNMYNKTGECLCHPANDGLPYFVPGGWTYEHRVNTPMGNGALASDSVLTIGV